MAVMHDHKGENISNGKYNVNEVDKEIECDLLTRILGPTKNEKNIDSNYSITLHGCMNTRNRRKKFKNFRILLDIGCTYFIIMSNMT